MLCHERIYMFFYKWIRTLLICGGHDIFLQDFRRGVYAYVLYVIFAIFFVSCFYTMAAYQLAQALAGLAYLSLALEVCHLIFTWRFSFDLTILFQILIKLYSIRYRVAIIGMIDKIINIYTQNSNIKAFKRYQLCERFTFYTEYIFKIGMSLYSLSVTTYYLYPAYTYITERKLIPIIDLYFPGIDENTPTGYVTYLIFHTTLSVLALIASSCSDFLFTMIIINVPFMATILSENIDELNEILRDEDHDRHFAKMKLRNIILIHKEFNE